MSAQPIESLQGRQICIDTNVFIRALGRIKLPDAIHVAAAIAARCDVFLSEDADIPVPPALQHVPLSALV